MLVPTPWPEARTLDAGRRPALVDLYRAHRGLYGVRKLWPAARRAGRPWGWDQVGRLMGPPRTMAPVAGEGPW
jgi:hypothetical protein